MILGIGAFMRPSIIRNREVCDKIMVSIVMYSNITHSVHLSLLFVFLLFTSLATFCFFFRVWGFA